MCPPNTHLEGYITITMAQMSPPYMGVMASQAPAYNAETVTSPINYDLLRLGLEATPPPHANTSGASDHYNGRERVSPDPRENAPFEAFHGSPKGAHPSYSIDARLWDQ